MKFSTHVPFLNRPDLLLNCVRSIEALRPVHIWADGVEPPVTFGAFHHRLPPLTFTGVMNMIFHWAITAGDDVVFFAHNDCFAQDDVAERFGKLTEEKFESGEPWGAIFTNYDVLCAFNVAAIKDVGYWDCMMAQYVSDVDYYRRLTLGGWPCIWSELQVIHVNDASNTIKADEVFNKRTQFRTTQDRAYYEMKWGGKQGQERFDRPFADA